MEKGKIKWIFFDIGSTLVDESACELFRVRHLAAQPGAPDADTLCRMISEKAGKLQSAYKQTARELNLRITPWPSHLEKLYPDTVPALEYLSGRYRLGIIANQNPGLEKRLVGFGIRRYFDVIVSSAEAGIAKPDPAIFTHALETAKCDPYDAVMAGDRPDNDIAPAAALGMHTVLVRKGLYAESDISLIPYKPDIIIASISEIKNYF